MDIRSYFKIDLLKFENEISRLSKGLGVAPIAQSDNMDKVSPLKLFTTNI
jgi:hypothetical protein